MIGGIFDRASALLDRRLVLTSLMPLVAFAAVVFGLVAAAVSMTRIQRWWNHLGPAQVVVVIAGIAWLLLLAALLNAAQGRIIRLYEGYWGRNLIACRLRRAAVRRQLLRQSNLTPEDDEQYERRFRYFPRRREDVLPTRLGNILRAAELYPADPERYGMDANFFWPRLFTVLPDSLRASLAEARTSLELLLSVSVLAVALTAISLVSLAAGWGPALLSIAVSLAAAIGAWLGYIGAIYAAVIYGDLVRTAFDLYRGELLHQFGFVRPPSLAEERNIWQNLQQLLYRRAASDPGVLIDRPPQ